jgi:hypothetical protein
MSARKKRRSTQQIMEEKSVQIMRNNLPDEWVIHDYIPDYGIDKIVEIFEYNDNGNTADTLGELFFVQLKSIQKSKIEKITVFPILNIEKFHSGNNHFKDSEPIDIEVIKFKIETNVLLTIQSMGSGIPVLLFLVALDLEQVFFVCLNDLIDKVISPKDPSWKTKNSKTISIPIKNEVINESQKLIPLFYYAKRVKIYSAFVKFNYQESEVKYYLSNLISNYEYDEAESLEVNTYMIKPYAQALLYFIERLKSLDIWESTVRWPALDLCYKDLVDLENLLSKPTVNIHKLYWLAIRTWSQLRGLTNLYEEHCKEWYLPTHYSETSLANSDMSPKTS